jgi:hypothetical protein
MIFLGPDSETALKVWIDFYSYFPCFWAYLSERRNKPQCPRTIPMRHLELCENWLSEIHTFYVDANKMPYFLYFSPELDKIQYIRWPQKLLRNYEFSKNWCEIDTALKV